MKKFLLTQVLLREFLFIEVEFNIPAEGTQYIIFTDGAIKWRKGVRDAYFVLDKTLTLIGFNGTEDIDWENVRQMK